MGQAHYNIKVEYSKCGWTDSETYCGWDIEELSQYEAS